MTNEFDTTIKKILTNLNKHMITENILSNIELNKDTINENSAQSESSEMRIKFLNMITNFTLNV